MMQTLLDSAKTVYPNQHWGETEDEEGRKDIDFLGFFFWLE
jgi:hypothetical protein